MHWVSFRGGRGAGDRGGPPPPRGEPGGEAARGPSWAELGRPGATWGLAALRVPRPAPSEGGSSALILLLRRARDARGRMHLGAVISFPILLSARVVHDSKRKHEWSFKRPLPVDGGGGGWPASTCSLSPAGRPPLGHSPGHYLQKCHRVTGTPGFSHLRWFSWGPRVCGESSVRNRGRML